MDVSNQKLLLSYSQLDDDSELGRIGLGGGTIMEGANITASRVRNSPYYFLVTNVNTQARITRIFKMFVIKLKSIGIFLRMPLRGVDIPVLRFEDCQLG